MIACGKRGKGGKKEQARDGRGERRKSSNLPVEENISISASVVNKLHNFFKVITYRFVFDISHVNVQVFEFLILVLK